MKEERQGEWHKPAGASESKLALITVNFSISVSPGSSELTLAKNSKKSERKHLIWSVYVNMETEKDWEWVKVPCMFKVTSHKLFFFFFVW